MVKKASTAEAVPEAAAEPAEGFALDGNHEPPAATAETPDGKPKKSARRMVVDEEIQAMQDSFAIISALDERAAVRVMEWLNDRFRQKYVPEDVAT